MANKDKLAALKQAMRESAHSDQDIKGRHAIHIGQVGTFVNIKSLQLSKGCKNVSITLKIQSNR